MLGSRLGRSTYVVLGVVILMAGCSTGTSTVPATSTAPATSSAPSTSAVPAGQSVDQVCQLLADGEADDAVPAKVAGHRSGAPDRPRSCSWVDGPTQAAVVILTVAPPQDLVPGPRSFDVGSPCEPGSTGTDPTSPERGPSLHTTCFVDGLALVLLAETTELPKVMELLRRVVPRLDGLDRAKLGLPPPPPPGSPPAAQRTVPQECVDAWQAERVAPIRCEEYPEAYRAILRGRGGG